MTAGLWIKNDSGTIQIDETWRNYGLRAKGTVTTTSDSTFTTSLFTITVAGTNPLIAIYSTTNWIILQVTKSGSNTVFTGLCSGAAGTSITYYWFDVMTAVSGQTDGLNIWNEAGQLVFTSARPPLRIVDFLSGTVTASALSTSTTLVNTTYTTGRVYAVIPSLIGTRNFGQATGGTGPGVKFMLYNQSNRFRSITNGVATCDAPIQAPEGPSSQTWAYHYPDWGGIVVDVTNY